MRRVLAIPVPRIPARVLLLIAGTLITICLEQATSARAVVVEVNGTKAGMQAPEIRRYWDGTFKGTGLNTAGESNPSVLSFANPSANSVLHSVATYAIYWDPQDYYHGDWQGVIDNFLTNLGIAGGQLSNVFSVDTQYRDSTNQGATSHSSFRGAYTDTNAYPASACTNPHPLKAGAPLQEGHSVCLTDGQIRSQLQTFIAQHGLPAGMGTIYYVLTPPGVAACLDGGGATGHCSDFVGTIQEVEFAEAEGLETEALISYRHSFCSYHAAIGSGGAGTVLYAVIPWTAGGAGDTHLEGADETQAYECQDGGFAPGTKPGGEILEKEHAHVKSLQEEEEFAHKSAQEKREQEEAEALGLTGPREQEPNQLGSTRSPDGGFDEGLADLIINQITTEQQNTVTNPLLNAWQDSAGREVTDECRNFFLPIAGGGASASPDSRAGTLADQTFGGKSYYVNAALNMAAYRLPYPAVPCLLGVHIEARFSSPNAVSSGELVGFNGMESDITLNATAGYPSGKETYSVYSWNFGDGSPTVTGYAPGSAGANSPATGPCELPWLTPCAASVYHSYQYGGTYNVMLTVTDIAGNTSSVTHPITVAGPSPPSSASSASSSASSGSAAGAGAPGAPSGASSPPAVPAASASTLSHSLRSVLKSGLLVRYTVSEPVTGRFEVLLASPVARRLHLHGTAATGLPAGMAPQTVIGKAILVTQTGGRHTVRIVFNKSIASRLSGVRGVTFMLRIVVRNAAGGTTSVLTPVKLKR